MGFALMAVMILAPGAAPDGRMLIVILIMWAVVGLQIYMLKCVGMLTIQIKVVSYLGVNMTVV
jgi:hypothetical protein